MNKAWSVTRVRMVCSTVSLNPLVMCGFMVLFPVAAAMAAPDLEVVIQPIQVCEDGGSAPTSPGMALFEAEMDKIWAQAGIDVSFLPFNQYWKGSDKALWLSELSPKLIGGTWGPPTGVDPPAFFERAEGKNPDPLVLNLWFVDSISDDLFGSGGEVLGVSNSSVDLATGEPIWLNGMVVTDRIYDPGDPEYPLFDVVAHEMGHNLGLAHSDDPFGMWGGNPFELPENLMGSYLYPAGSIDNIYPDGIAYCQLTAEQIAVARSSPFVRPIAVIPAPGAILLATIGIGLVRPLRRRRKV